MFGDLDWSLNASRRFVSISWASWVMHAWRRYFTTVRRPIIAALQLLITGHSAHQLITLGHPECWGIGNKSNSWNKTPTRQSCNKLIWSVHKMKKLIISECYFVRNSPFRLAASVSWCWSWEKEGRAVEVVPAHWKFFMCTATRTSSHSPVGPSVFVYLA